MRKASVMLRSDLASSRSLGLTPSGTLYVWKSASAPVVKRVSVDLETGAIRQGLPTFQRFINSRGRPSFSADGRELLFMSCGSVGGPCTSSIHSADSGVVRDVRQTLNYVQVQRLSADGRLIAAMGTDLKGRRGIYLIDPVFDVSPSGEIAFTASTGATGAEVWALENILPAARAKR